MAKKAKKSNQKNLIIGICCAVAVVIVIAIAIIFASSKTQKLDDAYFVSDDTKLVLTIDDVEEEYEGAEKAYVVYTYSGDKITGAINYVKFKDSEAAKSNIAIYKEAVGDEAKKVYANDSYLVIEMAEDSYKDTTASEVKQYIELMESLKDLDLNDVEIDYDEED